LCVCRQKGAEAKSRTRHATQGMCGIDYTVEVTWSLQKHVTWDKLMTGTPTSCSV